MPERAAVIRGRNVIFEGMAYEDGSLAYIDGNQLLSRVIITEGAQFLQRNIWVDDCLSSKWPYSCFSITTGGGSRVELRDAIFSDATCVKWSESNGITAMINSAKFVKPLTVKTRDVNERELYVEDTGWVPYVPPTAYWRFVNVSLTCTGNITHDLPPEHIVLVDKRWNKKDQSLAIAITLVVLTTFYWLYFHHFSIPRETLIARKKGFDLQIELGQGRYGKVYRARHRVSGQYVAIKVISLKPTDWKELRAAWRECQVMSSLRHPSCVKIINYYSARVSQGNMVTNMPSPTPTHSTDFVDESTGGGGGGGDDSAIGSTGMASKGGNWGFYDVTAALDDFTARSLGSTELHAAAEAVLSGRRSVLSHSSKKSSEFSTSSASDSLPETDDSNASRVLSAASGDSDLDGLSGAPLDSLLLQVHLVMEYADQGTLYDSIKSGKFMNADRTPALPTVLATALDIGRGLVALHAPRHRMVHRDLSPNNVLLISEFNDRGFRAVLSDFGLSTVVSLGLTHKTSEAKGTLVYMPPELLVDNTVSTAIDIYSFGVLSKFYYFPLHLKKQQIKKERNSIFFLFNCSSVHVGASGTV